MRTRTLSFNVVYKLNFVENWSKKVYFIKLDSWWNNLLIKKEKNIKKRNEKREKQLWIDKKM